MSTPSYKTLSPDSGDIIVLLSSQISLQLAASANGSTFSVAHTSIYSADHLSSLITTLLDQWACDFLHRSEMRSAPMVRARIFSYLYNGLKRFNMHAVVEVIPLLLHASLLLFLWPFLPVNRIIMGVAAGLLALLVLIYATLTILPILSLDCPFRTPLCESFTHRCRCHVVRTWIKKSKSLVQPTTTHPALVNLKRPSLQPSPLAETTPDVPHLLEFQHNCDAPQCIKGFVHEVLRHSRTSGSVLKTAMCYLRLEAIRPKVPELMQKEQAGIGARGEPDADFRVTPATAAEIAQDAAECSQDNAVTIDRSNTTDEYLMDTVRMRRIWPARSTAARSSLPT
ncbi:hypothetical protein C8J57DRAFT_1583430 [Mycena rebaudengoi]|nr:hypothetical protein C8J57DRAFT_1583430 [Mycena rebaudengoi]